MKARLISTYLLEIDTDKVKDDATLNAFMSVVGTLGLDSALTLYNGISQVRDANGTPIVEHRLQNEE